MSPQRTKRARPWMQLLIFNSIALFAIWTTSSIMLNLILPFPHQSESDAWDSSIKLLPNSYSLGSMPQSHEAAPVVLALAVPSDTGVCPLLRNSKCACISGALAVDSVPFPFCAAQELGAVGAHFGAAKVHAAQQQFAAHTERGSWLLFPHLLRLNTPQAHLFAIFCSLCLSRVYFLSSDIQDFSDISDIGAYFSFFFDKGLSQIASRHALICCAFSRSNIRCLTFLLVGRQVMFMCINSLLARDCISDCVRFVSALICAFIVCHCMWSFCAAIC